MDRAQGAAQERMDKAQGAMQEGTYPIQERSGGTVGGICKRVQQMSQAVQSNGANKFCGCNCYCRITSEEDADSLTDYQDSSIPSPNQSYLCLQHLGESRARQILDLQGPMALPFGP